ncbi:MAG: hypothetical protein NTNFB01_00580 [Nitrospira sp.]
MTLITLGVADLAAALLNSPFEHPVFMKSLLERPLGKTTRQAVFFCGFFSMPTKTDTFACFDKA